MRLSRVLRSDEPIPDEPLPIRRILFWVAVAGGIVIGVILYFRHASALPPLLG